MLKNLWEIFALRVNIRTNVLAANGIHQPFDTPYMAIYTLKSHK
jgi:hypothetical protein